VAAFGEWVEACWFAEHDRAPARLEALLAFAPDVVLVGALWILGRLLELSDPRGLAAGVGDARDTTPTDLGGALAEHLLIAGPDPAREALIRAVVQSAGPDPQVGFLYPALMRESLTTQPSKSAAETLWRRAGFGPGDVDVAQFYDCFTITVLLQLEDYGFCPKGEGGPFAASGAIDKGGVVPINTSGGHLSEGYLHGMNHVVEGVRQIRGTSTSQVPGAEVCLVTSGLPVTTSGLILRRG